MTSRRCVIKLSGAAFGTETRRFDFVFLNRLITQILQLLKKDIEIILVLGGGNICRGKELQKALPEVKDNSFSFDYAGMLATLINGLVLKNLFLNCNHSVEIFSDLTIDEKILQKYTPEKVKKSLQKHRVVILTGGVGLPTFSTDVATFLKAKELEADTILLGKHRVDGIYSADPRRIPKAEWISEIRFSELISRRLEIIDLPAAAIGMDNDFSAFVFDITQDNALIKVWNREGKFTHVQN